MATYLHNSKAGFSYELLEKYEAGISLWGLEVKSIKQKHGSLNESYVIVENGELFLVKAHIPPYQPGNGTAAYDPYRKRKLLLNKKEIKEIERARHESGLTVIPISMYNKGNRIKLEIALARGKKLHDKRETLKKRDADRDIGRIMKARR